MSEAIALTADGNRMKTPDPGEFMLAGGDAAGDCLRRLRQHGQAWGDSAQRPAGARGQQLEGER